MFSFLLNDKRPFRELNVCGRTGQAASLFCANTSAHQQQMTGRKMSVSTLKYDSTMLCFTVCIESLVSYHNACKIADNYVADTLGVANIHIKPHHAMLAC